MLLAFNPYFSFIQCRIAEANMIGLSAGLALLCS
jgi:transketolase C-terminal domain/subunit